MVIHFRTLFTITFLYFFYTGFLYPQNQKFEFGRVPSSELEMTSYIGDKNAEAVVLYDIGKSYFIQVDGSFEVVFERTTRVKIFTEAGIKYSEAEIPFYQEGGIFERVYELEAFAYNLENNRVVITALNPANTFIEKTNEWWNVKKFAIPNVKSGTVIEYRYKLTSEYKTNLRDWEFQWRIPVVYSEYQVSMIPFYVYNFILQGASHFDSYTSHQNEGLRRRYGPVEYSDLVHKYVMKELPAFREETYITSIKDYIIKIDFQLATINHLNGIKEELVTTWQKLNNDLLKHPSFGKFIEQSRNSAKKEINPSELAGMSEEEKIDYLVDHVKKNYRWNNRNGKYAEKTLKQFQSTRLGNSANLNLFLVGLLQSAGIDAKAVIISTRENGKIRSLTTPFHHYFNSVIAIAQINGNIYTLDATDPLVPNNMLPIRCINDKGLIVNKNTADWIDFTINEASIIKRDFAISFDDSGKMIFQLINQSTGYDAVNFRKRLGENPQNVIQLLKDSGYDLAEEEPIISGFSDLLSPFRFEYYAAMEIPMVNNKLIIPPFLNEPLKENPFKQEKRNYPVDYVYPEERIFNSVITIPEGFEVEFLPSDFKFNNNLMEFNYAIKVEGNIIRVTGDYFLKKSIYQPNEYSSLKHFVGEIIKKLNQEIILIRNQ
jgi:hypothetical protein